MNSSAVPINFADMKTVPNILTVGRIVLAAIFLALLFRASAIEQPRRYLDIALVLFVVAVLTDMADGIIARRYQVVSKFGRIMDPLADKILVVGAFVSFALLNMPERLGTMTDVATSVVLWMAAGIIAARELVMTIVRHVAEKQGYNFQATWPGKLKMAVQSATIIATLVMLGRFSQALWAQWVVLIALVVTMVLTTVSAISALSPARWQKG